MKLIETSNDHNNEDSSLASNFLSNLPSDRFLILHKKPIEHEHQPVCLHAKSFCFHELKLFNSFVTVVVKALSLDHARGQAPYAQKVYIR